MTAWGHGRHLQPALAGGSVERVLTYAEHASGFSGGNEVGALALNHKRGRKSLHFAWIEPAVSAGSQDGTQNSLADGPDNSCPANAKTRGYCV